MKVIVADDEQMIVRGICEMLKNENLGVEVIDSCGDGKTLLKLICEKQPDIVISDIKMPEMSGIEVLKEVKRRGLDVHMIFISAYQEFEYAREGLKLGAVDYLDKPIDEEALKSIILKIRGKREIVFSNNSFCENDKLYYCVFVIKCFDIKKLQALYSYLNSAEGGFVCTRYHGELCVIFSGDTDLFGVYLSMAKTLLCDIEKNCKINAAGGIGAPYPGTAGISLSYREAEVGAGYSYFFNEIKVYEKNDIRLFHTAGTAPVPKLLNVLAADIEQLNLKNAYKTADEIAEAVRSGSRGIKDIAVMKLFSAAEHIHYATEHLKPGELYDSDSVLDSFKASQSYDEAVKYFKDMVAMRIQSAAAVTQKKTGEMTIRKIKQYVEDNISENIRLKTVAEKLFMNSYYLSVFFKKHAGVNFKDYVMDIKLQRARKYLEETDMKIYEIADAIGFCDQKHFSKVYKKTFGQTPLETRKKQSQEDENDI